MCLLYSEPGAGSDLTAISTRADARGEEFVITGQKVWTSGAHLADYGMLIARTDWDVPKHQGISFFFPMNRPGSRFVSDKAIVPAENLLGPLNGGWQVLQTALAYERSVMGDTARGARRKNPEREEENFFINLAREVGKLGDSAVRQRIAQVIAHRRLNQLNTRRAKAELEQGTSSIMSLGKLAMSRILHEEARRRIDLLGAESLLEGEEFPRADDANFLSLNAYFTSIGGGTDQIQRNIIGVRVLCLPREPEVDRTIPFRDVRAG